MKNLRLIAFAALAFGAASCEDVVDDLNVNPNEFTEVPSELVFRHITLNTAAIAEAEPARIAGMWSDQFAGTDRQYITQDDYGVTSNQFDDIWESLYQDGLAQALIAENLAIEEGNDVVANLSRIFQGYYAAEAALIFGDVPFSQVNDLDFADPAYESQREVLNSAINLITDAAGSAGSGNAVTSLNQTFAPTEVTWGGFANALAARYLLAQRDYAGALTAAQNAGFDDPSASVDIIHTTTNFQENLFFQFEAEQRADYLSFGNIGTEQSTLFSILNDTTSMSRADDKTDDAARRDFYFFADESGLYKLNVTATGFFAADQNFPVIGFPEVQLIIAEAAAREGDDETAIDALNAVRNYWNGVLGVDSYQDYEEDDFDDDDALLEAILTEKYVSVFGLPTFYDVIRTDNLLGVDTDGLSAPAQRFLYPSTEEASNSSFPGQAANGISTPTPINN